MDSIPDLSQGAWAMWTLSLGLGLVVTVVVALLLWWIVREAHGIDRVVARIWVAGQLVANNTIHIPLLYRTNEVAGEILANAVAIAGATAAIEAHARSCSGCPACLLATPARVATGAAP